MPINDEMNDRVVLVTGAAQGIGAAIGQSYADAGATVHLADCNGEGLQATANAFNARSHVVDLTVRKEVLALVRSIEKAHQRLDILVHAAGGVCGQDGTSIESVSDSDWQKIFAANVDSAFLLCQAIAPIMKKAAWGRIVTISSGAGLRPSLTGIQAYAAAKHALVGLTRQLSMELGPFGITVNSVAPGLVLSNPSTIRQWKRYSPERQTEIIEQTHVRRLGTASDISAAVMYLASDAAGWVSGQILSVDGGRS